MFHCNAHHWSLSNICQQMYICQSGVGLLFQVVLILWKTKNVQIIFPKDYRSRGCYSKSRQEVILPKGGYTKSIRRLLILKGWYSKLGKRVVILSQMKGSLFHSRPGRIAVMHILVQRHVLRAQHLKNLTPSHFQFGLWKIFVQVRGRPLSLNLSSTSLYYQFVTSLMTWIQQCMQWIVE